MALKESKHPVRSDYNSRRRCKIFFGMHSGRTERHPGSCICAPTPCSMLIGRGRLHELPPRWQLAWPQTGILSSCHRLQHPSLHVCVTTTWQVTITSCFREFRPDACIWCTSFLARRPHLHAWTSRLSAIQSEAMRLWTSLLCTCFCAPCCPPGCLSPPFGRGDSANAGSTLRSLQLSTGTARTRVPHGVCCFTRR
jgi:hypothetical protein